MHSIIDQTIRFHSWFPTK